MLILGFTHIAAIAAFVGVSASPVVPANDDAPCLSAIGTCGSDPDRLDQIEAWLRVQIAEDDADHDALFGELAFVRERLHGVRGPDRATPGLRIVA